MLFVYRAIWKLENQINFYTASAYTRMHNSSRNLEKIAILYDTSAPPWCAIKCIRSWIWKKWKLKTSWLRNAAWNWTIQLLQDYETLFRFFVAEFRSGTQMLSTSHLFSFLISEHSLLSHSHFKIPGIIFIDRLSHVSCLNANIANTNRNTITWRLCFLKIHHKLEFISQSWVLHSQSPVSKLKNEAEREGKVKQQVKLSFQYVVCTEGVEKGNEEREMEIGEYFTHLYNCWFVRWTTKVYNFSFFFLLFLLKRGLCRQVVNIILTEKYEIVIISATECVLWDFCRCRKSTKSSVAFNFCLGVICTIQFSVDVLLSFVCCV